MNKTFLSSGASAPSSVITTKYIVIEEILSAGILVFIVL